MECITNCKIIESCASRNRFELFANMEVQQAMYTNCITNFSEVGKTRAKHLQACPIC